MRVLRQVRRFAQRDSEAHGKRFAPYAKVPEMHIQDFA